MAVISSPKKVNPVKYVKKPSPVVGAADVDQPSTPIPVQLAAPKKFVAKKPVMTVTSEQVNNLEKKVTSSDSQIIEADTAMMVEEPHAVVGVTMAMTRNLQQYESFKFQVHVSVPCSNNDDAMSAAYDAAKDWVEQRVNALNEEVNEMMKPE